MSLIVCSSARGVIESNEITPLSQFWAACNAAIESARDRDWQIVHLILHGSNRHGSASPQLEIPANAAEPVLAFGADSSSFDTILGQNRCGRVELIGAFPGHMTLSLLQLMAERCLQPRVHEALFRLSGTAENAQSAVLAFLERSGALSRLPATRLVHDSSQNWTKANEEDRP